MSENAPNCVSYRRARFVASLPADRLYTASHFWLMAQPDGLWRAGLTRFATRMLGEIVELAFEVAPGQPITLGGKIGWIEGFKAISELYSVLDGVFIEANSDIDADITLVDSDPHGRGWLYRARGTPDPAAMDINAYMRLLDAAIDRMKSGAGSGEHG